MKTLILGAGNLLLSDEGFGVHFIRYLEHYHTGSGARLSPAAAVPASERSLISEPKLVTTRCGWGQPRSDHAPTAQSGSSVEPFLHVLPPDVELFDAGTLGLMIGHKLEEAERVYIVDVVDTPGTPGTCIRYTKEDFLLQRIPIKLSPHQISVQEMLLVSSLRGRCPEEIYLLGVIPGSLEPGTELSPVLKQRLPELAAQLVSELSVVRECPV
jgi:hydrogenase maturation protease